MTFELDEVQRASSMPAHIEYIMTDGRVVVCWGVRCVNYQMAARANRVTMYYLDGTKALLKELNLGL